MELVSVVITTYKRPMDVLKRAVDSVVQQTYKNIEIFVVNDNPENLSLTKQIQKLCASYSQKVQYLAPEKNSGACAARNLGLKYAKGTFISFLDDDDYWLKNKIDIQKKGFVTKDIGVVYTPYYLYYNGKRRLVKSFEKNGKLTEDLLYRNSMSIFPLMRTELVRMVGGFDEKLQSGQEHDLLLRLSLETNFKYVAVPTAIYDVSEESISMNINKKIKGFERFLTKHRILYRHHPRAYHYQLIHMVNNMNNAGQYAYAFRLWRECLAYHFWSLDNIRQPLKGLIKRIMGRRAFH